jgi:hypothetical protein
VRTKFRRLHDFTGNIPKSHEPQLQHLATVQLLAMEGKGKTFSENKIINLFISKESNTFTSSAQHEPVMAQFE